MGDLGMEEKIQSQVIVFLYVLQSQILQNKREINISAGLFSTEPPSSIPEPQKSLTLFWQFESVSLDAISQHMTCPQTVRGHGPFLGGPWKNKQIDIETTRVDKQESSATLTAIF